MQLHHATPLRRLDQWSDFRVVSLSDSPLELWLMQPLDPLSVQRPDLLSALVAELLSAPINHLPLLTLSEPWSNSPLVTFSSLSTAQSSARQLDPLLSSRSDWSIN